MQIVRDLAGYSMGEADNIRRAMSKKKQYVIDEGRDYFVNGNADKNIVGCVANGIDAAVANGIYDSMTDFAKYAFNKSHAACYAVVAYQTAWLKYYYPVEFMAALMTTVIDNTAKVSEYILTCRQMGIELLPPDVNEGESGFSVSKGRIRYALTAIKGVGRNIIDAIVAERSTYGPYSGLDDFITRNIDNELNKRVVENFIKAGAFDSFGGTRKQYMSIYQSVMDHIMGDRKNNMAGQMSLFDIVDDSMKDDFDIKLPDVGEYRKDLLLAFEKEVLGIYVSGHPLEEVEGLWRKHTTRHVSDLIYQEEIQGMLAADGEVATLGGIIADKSIKYTKNDQPMAFVTLEDLTGSVECIVFPKTYQKYANMLEVDRKVFIQGRVDAGDEQDGKLMVQTVTPFEDMARSVWIKFDTLESYNEKEAALNAVIYESDGKDEVVIYIANPPMKKVLPKNMTVNANENLIQALTQQFGNDNVKLV